MISAGWVPSREDFTCWLLFFFSSRRRHTRFDCDWSSDVCSSDLPVAAVVPGAIRPACLPARISRVILHRLSVHRCPQLLGGVEDITACEEASHLGLTDRKSVV